MSNGRKRNGEGSVWRRSDGRWSGAAYVPLPGGRIERRYVYGRTEYEAREKIQRMLDNADKGIPTTPAGLTVRLYLEEWLDYISAHVRPSTYAGYESNTRLHLIPRIGKKLLINYPYAMFDSWSPQCVKMACSPELFSMSTSVDEARDFLQAVQGHRLAAMWTCVLLLGLRRSEACGLRWSDVNLDERTIHIARGVHRVNGSLTALPTKTRRSNRTVPLPDLCVRVLKQYQDAQQHLREEQGLAWVETGYLFTTRYGTPIEPRNLTRMFGHICEKHGLRQIRLHDLRHSCVSLLLALGVHPRVVMEIVGHSAIEMTMNIYGHVNLDVQRAALTQLNDELDG